MSTEAFPHKILREFPWLWSIQDSWDRDSPVHVHRLYYPQALNKIIADPKDWRQGLSNKYGTYTVYEGRGVVSKGTAEKSSVTITSAIRDIVGHGFEPEVVKFVVAHGSGLVQVYRPGVATTFAQLYRQVS